MMLPLFCLFLIINIAITHSNPIINCDTNKDCYIECSDPQSCQNTIITCPTTGKCDIKCQGNESCNNATIIATQSIGDFNLLCSSDPFEYNGNCKNITVYGSETTTNSPYDFTITCDQNEQSCAYSTIHCPKHSNCNIHCHNTESCKNITINAPINNDLYIHCNGSSSCYDSTINAQYSSLLNITGCIKHDSCLYLSIHCPPHSNRHKNCYIEGNNNLNGIEIYAINGWNDIQITHIGNNSMQHFGTMYCTNDMSIQCDISNNNWLCNNSNDYCNNIITTTKYTQLIVNTPSNPSQDIISTLTSIILMNDNGPILNKQENNHLFSIHISVETIIMFSGSMILLLVCIIGSCCIYKLHRKYNQEKYKKESIDIIHKINKINIPISDNNTPTTPTTQNTTHYHHTNSSFGGQIIFGQSTPSISNNASNTNFNLSIPSINENRNRNPYKSQRLKANTIDITHSVHENNLSHVYNMKKRHPSVDAYTPNNEIQFVNVVRNGLHNVINRSSSSLVPPILNNSSGSGSGSGSSRNIYNSMQISSVSHSPKSPCSNHSNRSNHSENTMHLSASMNNINSQIIARNTVNSPHNFSVPNYTNNSVPNYSGQYLDVRNRNCTLADININKELPLSPPNAQQLNLEMDMNVDEIHIENENDIDEFEENESDSDLFIQQEKTPQAPIHPPPVPKHILASYID